QAGPEVTATRGHLRRSEPARTWARSLLDSLEQLYPNGWLPAIPDGDRGVRQRAARRTATAPAAPQGPEVRAAVGRRRLLAAAGALAALVLVAVLVWPIGVLTGDDDEPAAEQAGASAGGDQGGAASSRGQAIIASQGGHGRPQIIVTASGLPPSTQRSAYQVWLYNSEQDRRSIGAQVTDAQGTLQAGGPLPGDYRDYRFIDVTKVAVNGQSFRTGDSILRRAARAPRPAGHPRDREQAHHAAGGHPAAAAATGQPLSATTTAAASRGS
ncbi:MAG TPA: anti-sigma factor, partial [Thermoleophilaceae bacterium]|nr:anti-sigma factor [Thermoleophilaceae bacterium]